MDISLDAVSEDIVMRLQTGANRRNSAMHTPVVGTADGDLRVMVLREFDPERNTLRFHTDARSPKASAIAANAAVHVLAFDPDAKVQIRMRGRGRIETAGPAADQAWAEATPFAKRCYLAEHAPSAEAEQQTSGLPEWVEGITPTDEQVEAGRANFSVLLIEVEAYDWLYLANTGHRRALVSQLGAGSTANWLVP